MIGWNIYTFYNDNKSLAEADSGYFYYHIYRTEHSNNQGKHGKYLTSVNRTFYRNGIFLLQKFAYIKASMVGC